MQAAEALAAAETHASSGTHRRGDEDERLKQRGPQAGGGPRAGLSQVEAEGERGRKLGGIKQHACRSGGEGRGQEEKLFSSRPPALKDEALGMQRAAAWHLAGAAGTKCYVVPGLGMHACKT